MLLYLDNAATSYPKPPAVYQAVDDAMSRVGASPGRGSYRLAREASDIVSAARIRVAEVLGVDDPTRVCFTRNATESLNVVLKGWLRPGDRVLVSSMEHNAVMRPLARLQEAGVRVETIPARAGGMLDLDALRSLLEPPPRLVALVHACNVNGALQPVAEAAQLCDERGVALLLDAAQTAGVQPIRAVQWRLGMVACSGHKALLGPPGLGVLYVRPDLDVPPLIEGGTGSRSEEDTQPRAVPDRYESGTLNLPAIAGLAAGIDFIRDQGMDAICRHEQRLAALIEQELERMTDVTVYRPEVRGTGATAFNVVGMNPGDVGHLLDEGFDIAVRTGLHCAPLAHRTLGTFPHGCVRVSPGWFTREEDLEVLFNALRTLLSMRRSGR